MGDVVEIRCPAHPGRLLLKVARPVEVEGANTIEVACRDCRRDLRRSGQHATLVIHRYSVGGNDVATFVL